MRNVHHFFKKVTIISHKNFASFFIILILQMFYKKLKPLYLQGV